MKNPLVQVCIVLIITIAAITFYASSPLKLQFFGIDLKKADLTELLQNNISQKENISKEIHSYELADFGNIYADSASSIDSTEQRILLIGDSMTEGIMRAMNDYCQANHHQLFSVVWTSSSIHGWCKSGRLKSFVERFSPTYVIIILGSNELFVPNSPARENSIKELLAQAEPAKIVWIGPPNWKPDKGIYSQLLEVLGERRVFLSKNLSFERQKDGIHPTYKSSRYWTEAISEWIMSESMYKIVLNKPGISSDIRPEVIYYNN